MKSSSTVWSSVLLAGLAIAGRAGAISLPDSGSASCAGSCLTITNSGTNGIGIQANSFTGAGIGVSGDAAASTGTGVRGAGAYGVVGYTTLTGGYGVGGLVSGAVNATGVYGESKGTYNGVWGKANSSNASGVYGVNTAGHGVAGRISPAGAGNAIYGDNNNAGGYAGYFNGKLLVTGTPYANQTTFSPISDGRLKKNVEPLTGALDELLKLRGVTFEWKNADQHDNQVGRQRGFIAQDVEKAIPDWVTEDPEGYKRLSLRGYEAMVVESIRTLKTENDALRNRVKALEERRLVASAGLNGNGFLGVAGLVAIGAALVLTRQRRPG